MLAYGSRTDARHLGESRSVPDNGQVNENFGVYRSLRISETNGMSVVSGRRLTGFLAGLRRRIRVLCQPRSENRPGLPIFFGEAGMSVVSGRRLTGFLAGLRRRIRVLCQPRSENCPGLPIFFGEAGNTASLPMASDSWSISPRTKARPRPSR